MTLVMAEYQRLPPIDVWGDAADEYTVLILILSRVLIQPVACHPRLYRRGCPLSVFVSSPAVLATSR